MLQQFIVRFLLHVLPSGFKRIRHYGIFARTRRRGQLTRCRPALHMPAPDLAVIETVEVSLRQATGREMSCCPHCGQAAMRVMEVIAPRR